MAKLKILKTGETDIESTDIWRFIFHSDYSTFKIATSGSQLFTISSGSDESHYDVVHNLGYEPIYFANILKNTKSYQVPADMDSGIDVASSSGTSRIRFYSQIIDTNTIRIGAYTADGGTVTSNESFTSYWIINLDEF